MIDANTQAIDQIDEQQRKVDEAVSLYGNHVYKRFLETYRTQHRETLVDILMDDPAAWFNGDNTNLTLALEIGDSKEIARAIENILESVAETLITREMVADMCLEMAAP